MFAWICLGLQISHEFLRYMRGGGGGGEVVLRDRKVLRVSQTTSAAFGSMLCDLPQDHNGKVRGGKDLPGSAAYTRAFCRALFSVWLVAYQASQP